MICVKPSGHSGRCRDSSGTSWENDHPTCERCQTLAGWLDERTRERDAARRDLADLGGLVGALRALADRLDDALSGSSECAGQLTLDDALEAP